MDKHTLLTKYLLPEEKLFLMGQVYFIEENTSGPAPPSLNTIRAPREKTVYFSPNTLEFIPDHLIRKSICHDQDIDTIGDGTKFRCSLIAPQDSALALRGIEICTQVQNSSHLSSSKDNKKAR